NTINLGNLATDAIDLTGVTNINGGNLTVDAPQTDINSGVINLGTDATDDVTINAEVQGGSPLVFQGATDNVNTTTFAITDPTAARTITFPDASGTVLLDANVGTIASQNSNSVSITGGAIDGTTIGGTTPAAGTFTTGTITTADINGGAIDGTAIGSTAASSGSFTTLNATGATTLNGAVTLGDALADAVTVSGTVAGANPLVFEGATTDINDLTIAITDPTAARTITFPDASGTVALDNNGASALTTAEIDQLENIDLTTISTTQWGYLGATNQGVATTDNVTFNQVTGTLQTAAQPNVTSVGTLTSVTSSGAISTTGTLNADGVVTLGTAGNTTTVEGALAVTEATTLNGAVTLGDAAADIITVTGTVAGASPLVFEGLTVDAFETTIAVTDPTASRTITLPDASGTVLLDASTLGTFASGTTITDNATVKSALDELDAAVSAVSTPTLTQVLTAGAAAGNNSITGVNDLGATSLTLGGTPITSTGAELNILDGITSTTAELNILDGVTATASELNYLAGVTAGTAAANKALVVNGTNDISLGTGDFTATDITASNVLTVGTTALKTYADGKVSIGYSAFPTGYTDGATDAGVIFEGANDNAVISQSANPITGFSFNPTNTQLAVSGDVMIDGQIGTTGSMIAGGFTATSDRRLKDEIEELPNSLSSVTKLRGVSYFWKEDTKQFASDQSKQLGVIAQEIEIVFPELVTTHENGLKTVNYQGLIPVLIEAIKEQQKLIEKLMADLSNEKTTKEEMKAALDKQMKLSEMQMKLMSQLQMENSSMKSDIDLIKEQMGIKSATKTNE
ncbi:MAG: tail fiber domain-containing protein, partial [Imperialibacter sp.]|uniref:tail fiber domain-containing protein n=1 Tax=Imperialibacter sp. TaxID=2038411 RepID=UPI0032EFDF9B